MVLEDDVPGAWSRWVEAVASVVAVGVVLWLPLHHAAVYFCFGGGCPGPSPEDTNTYRLLVGALALAVVVTFVTAAVRGARWSWGWHVAVALAGAASAALFAVPAVDWVDVVRPDPPAYDGGVPCHSGPPNDCPGG